MTSAHEYRVNLKRDTLPGPADCIVTRRGEFLIRRFVRHELRAAAESKAERVLRGHREAMAERFNG